MAAPLLSANDRVDGRYAARSPVDGSSTKTDHQRGTLLARVPVTRRFDLTDVQWAVLQPLLPKGKKPGRPPKWSKRQLIDGIRWRVRVGYRGGTCRNATGPGRRSTGCSGAGNGQESGSGSSPGCRPAPTRPG
ncbi:transposase [Micromonospora musae]|uniref:transposase n=1 Tax=Micromonospora musae TaxID=1894970 RepID=UPI0018F59323|nr:transposase [Micromonospora musae]